MRLPIKTVVEITFSVADERVVKARRAFKGSFRTLHVTCARHHGCEDAISGSLGLVNHQLIAAGTWAFIKATGKIGCQCNGRHQPVFIQPEQQAA